MKFSDLSSVWTLKIVLLRRKTPVAVFVPGDINFVFPAAVLISFWSVQYLLIIVLTVFYRSFWTNFMVCIYVCFMQ